MKFPTQSDLHENVETKLKPVEHLKSIHAQSTSNNSILFVN